MKISNQYLPIMLLLLSTGSEGGEEKKPGLTEQLISQFNEYIKNLEVLNFLTSDGQIVERQQQQNVERRQQPGFTDKFMSQLRMFGIPTLSSLGSKKSVQSQRSPRVPPAHVIRQPRKVASPNRYSHRRPKQRRRPRKKNNNNSGTAGKNFIASIIEPKVFGLGFVRAERALGFCRSKTQELVNEALQLLRRERTNAAQQVELGIGDRCRGFLADGEAKCSDAIGDIMGRFAEQLTVALRDGNEQCQKTQDRAVKLTRDEARRQFDAIFKREKARGEEEFQRRLKEGKEKGEIEFQQKVTEMKAQAEIYFNGNVTEGIEMAEKEFARKVAEGSEEGETECTNMITKACGNSTESEEYCEEITFFAGNPFYDDDDYEYDDDYDYGDLTSKL